MIVHSFVLVRNMVSSQRYYFILVVLLTNSSFKIIKIGYAIKEDNEIYRYVTPIFLHSGFLQLFINLFAQLRMGLYLERRWGTLFF